MIAIATSRCSSPFVSKEMQGEAIAPCHCSADMSAAIPLGEAHPTIHLEQIKPDRVWSLKEFEILHDMSKPIAIVVDGVYEDPHWWVRL